MHFALLGEYPALVHADQHLFSPGRCSHSDTTLYTLLVIRYTKHTWRHQNEPNAWSRPGLHLLGHGRHPAPGRRDGSNARWNASVPLKLPAHDAPGAGREARDRQVCEAELELARGIEAGTIIENFRLLRPTSTQPEGESARRGRPS